MESSGRITKSNIKDVVKYLKQYSGMVATVWIYDSTFNPNTQSVYGFYESEITKPTKIFFSDFDGTSFKLTFLDQMFPDVNFCTNIWYQEYSVLTQQRGPAIYVDPYVDITQTEISLTGLHFWPEEVVPDMRWNGYMYVVLKSWHKELVPYSFQDEIVYP